MDFPGIKYDDSILLKHVNGPNIQRGNLEKETTASVIAIRENSFANRIQVLMFHLLVKVNSSNAYYPDILFTFRIL